MMSSPFHLSRKLCLLKRPSYFNNATTISKRRLSNIKVHPLFNQWQLAPNVWRLEEKYFDSWNLANIYFVKGTDADLLVDTGIGVHYLPSYLLWSKLREDKDKPLIVALTHTHFDHSGGAYQFAELPSTQGIYVHHEEIDSMKFGSKYQTAAWITSDEILPKPNSEWKAQNYSVQPIGSDVLKDLKDGDVIKLGNNTLVEVMHFPGHSRGSLGFFFDGILVTGDTVYRTDHELIDWYPGSSSIDMASSVTKILNMSHEVNLALPGHNDVLNRKQLIKACEGHIQSCGKWRTLRKTMSRTRANIILAINAQSKFTVPSVAEHAMRQWIMN